MFCWGTHQGGKSWKDYLSNAPEGDYFEIQAGLAQTQLHGMIVDPHEVLDFVQCFGGTSLNTEPYYVEDWHEAKSNLQDNINELVTSKKIDELLEEYRQYADIKPEKILSIGSGFGALEAYRREFAGEKSIPNSLVFPHTSICEEQLPWINLLENAYYPELDNESIPSSFMILPVWEELLRNSLNHDEAQHWATYAQLNVMLMDQGKYEEAYEMVKLSLEASPNPLAYRNKAILEEKQGNIELSYKNYEKALELAKDIAYLSILIEYFELLLREEEYKQLWGIFENLSDDSKNYERILLYTAKTAIELDKLDFVPQIFDREYASIRENETILSDIWLDYQRKIEIKKQGIEDISLREVEKLHPVPEHLDLRTGVDIEK